MSTLIVRAARTLADDPQVMASALSAYGRRARLDELTIATWLGVVPEHLSHLALCRRPDPASPTFAAEVSALAAYVGCVPERLRTLLEQVAVTRRPA